MLDCFRVVISFGDETIEFTSYSVNAKKITLENLKGHRFADCKIYTSKGDLYTHYVYDNGKGIYLKTEGKIKESIK